MRARPHRRLDAVVVRFVLTLVTLVGVLLSGPPPAWAHDGDDDTDAEHAAADLVGVPMSRIEAETAASERRLAAAGRRTASDPTPRVKVSADPGLSGAWSEVIPTDVVPVFQALLPSGKVLMWDSVGDGAAESSSVHDFTRALVWDPTSNTSKRVDVQGYNIFCAGYTQLADGNVLVVGGNKDEKLAGIRQTHLFDWRTERWSRGPDMAAGRWYPSVAALGGGEALIVAGGPAQAEVYQTDGALRTLTGFSSYAARVYPFLVPRNDGRVELVGPAATMNTMTTAGVGSLAATLRRDGINRSYGSIATYRPGLTLVAGGGDLTEGGVTHVPTRTAMIVDTTGATTKVTRTTSMAFARRQHNLTLLADGSVLATGGQASAVNRFIDFVHPTKAAERWDPATATWTTLASAARIREYHSAATLLPDGRVLTGGGGVCGQCVTLGYLEKNIEYYTPPYLYGKDGSGALATHPVMSGVPATARVGTRFTVVSAQASSIGKLGLVRLGADTHSIDMGQRYVPLSFSRTGTALDVAAPANGNLAPPGYYLMFAVDAQGVPSMGSMIQIVGPASGPVSGQAANGAGSCLDLRTGSSADGTGVIVNRCASRVSQRWSTDSATRSVRALGKCLTVAGGVVRVRAPVQLITCDGSAPQRWTRYTDHSLRPAGAPTLCLDTLRGLDIRAMPTELRVCTGAPTQRWTW